MMPNLETTRLREQAAEMLSVPASNSFAEAKSSFLDRLQQVDHQPPENWCTGLALLDDRNQLAKRPIAAPGVERARRQLLRREVDAFAADYWNYLPEERKSRWQALTDAIENEPALTTHLRHLANGLEVSADQFEGFQGKTANLAMTIKELFPMRPPQQAARRREWLMETADSPTLWMNSAIRLRENAPKVANLEPAILNVLAGRAAQKTMRPPTRYQPVRPIHPTTVQSKTSNNWGYWAIAVVVFAMLKGIFSTSSSSTKTPTPSYTPPPYSSTPFRYEPPQRVDFQEFEKQNKRPSDALQKALKEIEENRSKLLYSVYDPKTGKNVPLLKSPPADPLNPKKDPQDPRSLFKSGASP